jgi:hypothetical protein
MKDAQTYVDEIVLPTIREFEREPASRGEHFSRALLSSIPSITWRRNPVH